MHLSSWTSICNRICLAFYGLGFPTCLLANCAPISLLNHTTHSLWEHLAGTFSRHASSLLSHFWMIVAMRPFCLQMRNVFLHSYSCSECWTLKYKAYAWDVECLTTWRGLYLSSVHLCGGFLSLITLCLCLMDLFCPYLPRKVFHGWHQSSVFGFVLGPWFLLSFLQLALPPI